MELPWYWFLSMYFHTNVPLWLVMTMFVVCAGTIAWRWNLRYKTLLVAYCLFIVCHAVVFRPYSVEAKCILEPFWNYKLFSGNELEDLGEILMNIALFVPVGVLGGLSNKGKLPFAMCVLLCIAFSTSIEASQYFLHRGLCETDDVIHNTLGFMIGYGLVILTINLIRIIRRKCYTQ